MTTHKEIIKLDCGCTYEKTTTRTGHTICTTEKDIKECKKHKKIRIEKEKERKKFETFPNKKSKKIFTLIDKMMDELYDNGVDVSYFPMEAKKVLKEYAIKIDKLNR